MMSADKHTWGQSTIEFTFAMIVIMFLVYGMVQVFRWAGMDLANRRYTQDVLLTTNPAGGDPAAQLNIDEDLVLPIAAVYHGRITNGNRGNDEK
jgi:divalent metal cation (Fe/Co/Zn/Cd) transporter